MDSNLAWHLLTWCSKSSFLFCRAKLLSFSKCSEASEGETLAAAGIFSVSSGSSSSSASLARVIRSASQFSPCCWQVSRLSSMAANSSRMIPSKISSNSGQSGRGSSGPYTSSLIPHLVKHLAIVVSCTDYRA